MTSDFVDNILGKFCIVFLANTDQAIIFKGKQLNMAATVEGMVVKVSRDFLYMSEGSDDKISKVVSRKQIGYIHIEPEKEDGLGMISVADIAGEDGGTTH